MAWRMDLDFQHRLLEPAVGREPDGRLRLRLKRGPEEIAVFLSLASLEALLYEVSIGLARIKAC
jgi:hypothetical protein